MGQGHSRIKALGGFARFLNGNWQREVILIDTLRIFEEVIGCIRASGYLVENGNFELKAKIGEPIDLDSSEVVCSANKILSILNDEEYDCEAISLNDRGLYVIPLTSGKGSIGFILFEIAKLAENQMELAATVATVASMALKNADQSQERVKIDDIVATFASGHNMEDSYVLFANR